MVAYMRRWPAPDADDDEHRDEHRFPEHVEQQRVEGGEHTDHDAFHASGRRPSTAPACTLITCQPATTTSGVKKVVSRISGIEMPSMPR